MTNSAQLRWLAPEPAAPDQDWLGRITERGLVEWFRAFACFPQIDHSLFTWVATALPRSGERTTWPAFSRWLVHSGGATCHRLPAGQALRLTASWAANAKALAGIAAPGAVPVESRLVDGWLERPRLRFLPVVTEWAFALHRWDALERIWCEHLDGGRAARRPQAVAVFRRLPEEARRERPALTWATAVASGVESDQPELALIRVVVRDALLLHSSWTARPGLDEAVLAGTMWMLGQRMLPGAPSHRVIEDAQATGAALHALVSRRCAAGESLSEMCRTVLAVVSAQVALAGGDLTTAVANGNLAVILRAAGPEIDLFARGVVQLGLALGGVPLLDRAGERSPRALPESGVGLGPAGRHGLVMLRLARGLRALDELDRDGCEEMLRQVTVEQAWGAGVGAVRVYAAAVHAVLWGSPESALSTLDATVARVAGRSPELVEPLGERLIARARILILNRLLAVDSGSSPLEGMEDSARWVAQARRHLWAGRFEDAVRCADQGTLDAGTWLKDRVHLTMIRSAAVLTDPVAGAPAREQAVLAAAAAVNEGGALLAIALLPRVSRDALVDHLSGQLQELASPPGSLALERLSGLGTDGVSAQRVRLTWREQVLLPLLASSETVPEIARSLHLSPNTVRKQVASLRGKFQASSRTELIRNARRSGMLR